MTFLLLFLRWLSNCREDLHRFSAEKSGRGQYVSIEGVLNAELREVARVRILEAWDGTLADDRCRARLRPVPRKGR